MKAEQLWASILQEAIQGRLVPQLESEPELKQIGKSLEEPPFDIPNKWKWMQLKHLVKVIGGTSYKSADVIKSGVRIIRGGNLRDFSIQIRDDDVFLPVSFASDEKTVHQSDIVIVSSTGSKEVIGRPAVLKSNIKCQIGAFLRIIRPVVEEYSDYLKVIFQSDYYRNHIRATVSGTNINNVKNSYIENFYIPVPPIEEQRRIVECIQKLRPLVDAYQDAEKELESIEAYFPVKLKASILQEAIQGKLVPQLESEPEVETFSSEPDDPPFDIPDKWKWAKFRDVVDVRDGTHDTPKYQISGVPLVTSKNLRNGTIDFNNVKYISEEDHIEISKRSKVEKGDILFAMIGTVGNPAIVGNDSIFSIKNVALFKPLYDSKLNFEFLYYLLLFAQNQMIKESSGGVQRFVSLKYLRNFYIPVPPLGEQQRIVSRIKKLISTLEAL